MYTVDEFMEEFERQLKICAGDDESFLVDSPDGLEKGSKMVSGLSRKWLDSDDEDASIYGMAKRFYERYSQLYIGSASNENDLSSIEIEFKFNER
jgi:hypothetical protein